MARTGFYVDGFNLYHAIDAIGRNELKWLNLKELARSYLRQDDELVRVCYFTSVHLHNADKAKRHNIYIDALKALGVEVVKSNFQRVAKFCNRYERYCNFSEEKRTDVALATSYLIDALSGAVDRVLLVTADSDQIPSIEAVQVHRPAISVELLIPPGRYQQARELGSKFVDRPREIKTQRLQSCLLPREVANASGKIVARMPAAYVPRST